MYKISYNYTNFKGDVGGGVLGGSYSGAALAGVGYLTGQPELVVGGKVLGASGAILKSSAAAIATKCTIVS